MAALRTFQDNSATVSGAISAAITQVRTVIGLRAGLDVVTQLFPFAISCMTGLLAGVLSFKEIAMGSQMSGRDQEALHRYSALVISTVVCIMLVPMLLLPVFMFQFITSYLFALTIYGTVLMNGSFLLMANTRGVTGVTSVGTACCTARGGGATGRAAAALHGIGLLLILLGIILEVLLGPYKVYLNPYDDWLLIVKILFDFILKSFLTQAFTLAVCTRASGYLFEAFDGIYYRKDFEQDEASHLPNVAQVNLNYSTSGPKAATDLRAAEPKCATLESAGAVASAVVTA